MYFCTQNNILTSSSSLLLLSFCIYIVVVLSLNVVYVYYNINYIVCVHVLVRTHIVEYVLPLMDLLFCYMLTVDHCDATVRPRIYFALYIHQVIEWVRTNIACVYNVECACLPACLNDPALQSPCVCARLLFVWK